MSTEEAAAYRDKARVELNAIIALAGAGNDQLLKDAAEAAREILARIEVSTSSAEADRVMWQ